MIEFSGGDAQRRRRRLSIHAPSSPLLTRVRRHRSWLGSFFSHLRRVVSYIAKVGNFPPFSPCLRERNYSGNCRWAFDCIRFTFSLRVQISSSYSTVKMNQKIIALVVGATELHAEMDGMKEPSRGLHCIKKFWKHLISSKRQSKKAVIIKRSFLFRN